LCGAAPATIKVPQNTRKLGPTEFSKFLDLAGNAKIVINSRSPFRDGAHERIFYGLSRGAAILTDGQEYLLRDQNELPLEVYSYSTIAESVDRLRTRISRVSEDDYLATLESYSATQTWRTRARSILDFMIDRHVLEI